jgi:hypothetical protein
MSIQLPYARETLEVVSNVIILVLGCGLTAKEILSLA